MTANEPNLPATVSRDGWLEGDRAWEGIDRISHKYTDQPYPLCTDRVVFLIEPEHAFAQQFG